MHKKAGPNWPGNVKVKPPEGNTSWQGWEENRQLVNYQCTGPRRFATNELSKSRNLAKSCASTVPRPLGFSVSKSDDAFGPVEQATKPHRVIPRWAGSQSPSAGQPEASFAGFSGSSSRFAHSDFALFERPRICSRVSGRPRGEEAHRAGQRTTGRIVVAASPSPASGVQHPSSNGDLKNNEKSTFVGCISCH